MACPSRVQIAALLLLPALADAFLTPPCVRGGVCGKHLPGLKRRVEEGRGLATSAPRGARTARMCGSNTVRAGTCSSSQVEVAPATDRMFGSLASLRFGELARNFEGMSLREAELLEMNKLSQGTTCLVATVPSEHPFAQGLPPPDVPGASNVREMLSLGWVSQEAADERLLQLESEWLAELSAGAQRAVIGAVDIQQLADPQQYPHLPLPGETIQAGLPLFYICNMVVVEGARGLGIGKKLLQAALFHAKGAGAKTVCLQVRHQNEAARRLYRAAGFEQPIDMETCSSILRSIKAKVETTDENECDLLVLEIQSAEQD